MGDEAKDPVRGADDPEEPGARGVPEEPGARGVPEEAGASRGTGDGDDPGRAGDGPRSEASTEYARNADAEDAGQG